MTAINAPLRQRQQALQRAQEVRLGHCRIKENIAVLGRQDGCNLVATMLDDPTGLVPSMRVGPLLCSPDRVGKTAMRRWLSKAQVGSAERRVSELSGRQRELLAGLLREFAGGRR